METYKLYPFSLGELLGTPEKFIDKAFEGDARLFKTEPIEREELVRRMVVGGFPPVQDLDEEGRRYWFNGYITAIIERDVKDYAALEGLAEFPGLLTHIASRAGGLSNTAELSRISGIKVATLHRYMQLLRAFFLVYELRTWNFKTGATMVKSPKLYLVDTGLLANRLGANVERVLSSKNLMDSFFENFVITEILKQTGWSKRFVSLYHYRTVSGVEVDLILQDEAGQVVGIEIKSGHTLYGSEFAGLRELKKRLGRRFVQGIVIYTGTEKIPFGEDLIALPVSSLWL